MLLKRGLELTIMWTCGVTFYWTAEFFFFGIGPCFKTLVVGVVSTNSSWSAKSQGTISLIVYLDCYSFGILGKLLLYSILVLAG